MKRNLLLTFALLAACPWIVPARGEGPEPIPPDRFAGLRAEIKPEPGGFEDVPWMTNLWEARRKAAAEGKPLFVWSGGGPPCGFT